MSTQSKTQELTGAQLLLECLIHEGVDKIFGYPGGAIMPVYDALYDYQNKIKHYLVRHEQGAVHAAQGYARVTKKVGIVLATSGPGATNLITGIADAQIDSTPLLCITGQVAYHLLGSNAFQETDVMGISLPITKWNIQISDANDIPKIIAKAFYIARTGRPGPVLIDITKNAQFQKVKFSGYTKCLQLRSYEPVPTLSEEKIDEAIELINQAKKPYIFCGQGILLADAVKEFTAFVEKSGIPVASTLLGLSVLPVNHKNYVGFLGMHGNYATNKQINEADLIIALGMRFDDRVTGDLKTFSPIAKKIHIDIDKMELNKNVKVTVPIHADLKDALISLNKKIKPKQYLEWFKEFENLEKEEITKIKQKVCFPTEGKILMAEVVKKLSDKTQGSAYIVTDVGQHQMIASRYYEFKHPYTNITSGGLGTMGFGLPAAIGVKVGVPDKQVVVIIGDGGFQMTCQELGVIMEEKIPVKIIILNNNFLGMVRQWQQLFFEKRYSFVSMANPDFVKLVEAYNIKAQKVEDRENLSTALDNMLASEESYFLEVVVEKEENVFPMVPTGACVTDMRLE